MLLAYNILAKGLVAKWQGSGLQNRDSAVQIRPRPPEDFISEEQVLPRQPDSECLQLPDCF